jgi:hypothetical protein
MFGNAPVPFTVSWSGEADFYVADCPHARLRAICQSVAPGSGKPQFGKPHSQRQREAIARRLCDLCGRSLKNRTKVSLSHARVRSNGAEGPCIMQVEPLVHRECGARCIRFCPSLKRDIETGSLMVRQINRYRVQFAIRTRNTSRITSPATSPPPPTGLLVTPRSSSGHGPIGIKHGWKEQQDETRHSRRGAR